MDDKDRPPACLKPLRDNAAVSTYEAEMPDGARVVVKRLDPRQATGDPLAFRRFRRERHLAGLLRHPSLPALVAEGQHWLAFDYLQPSLGDPVCARSHATSTAVRQLLQPLAGTLAYIHARGIVHADIKPAHVMFRGADPVLVDFGIAVFACKDPIASTDFVGTPAWAAPEQMAGGKPGPAADIWSLSAVCFWLLSGTRPYSGGLDEVIDKRRMGAGPEFDLAAVEVLDDPDLAALLLRGLGRPETRPTAGGIVDFLSVRR